MKYSFAYRDLWNVAGGWLFCLDPCRPDDFCPLFSFFDDQPAEIGGRASEHRTSKIGKPGLDLGIGEGSVELLVELVDDLGRCVLRCADAIPCASFEAWHGIADGWNVWERLQPPHRSHGERAQLARPDVFDRRRHGGEHDLHLSAEQIGECGPRAAIRYVNHTDTGQHLEQFAGDMSPGAGAA